MARCARLLAGVVVGLALVLSLPRQAAALTITFETLSEGDVVTTQFAGVTIANATVQMAGSLLNEADFPPASGVNAVFDDGGPIRVDFLSPVTKFGVYVNYVVPVSLSAFNSSNNLLGAVTSLFNVNAVSFADPGSSPNEFLEVAFANMSYVTITGDPGGGSFTADDFTLTSPVTPVPEPGTLGFLLLGASVAARYRLRSEKRKRRLSTAASSTIREEPVE